MDPINNEIDINEEAAEPTISVREHTSNKEIFSQNKFLLG
jgi:hypothetical protein